MSVHDDERERILTALYEALQVILEEPHGCPPRGEESAD